MLSRPLLSVLCAAAMLAALGVSPARAQDAKASVAVTLGAMDSVIPPFGLKEGIFKKHGIDLSIVGVRNGPELVSAVVSGSADFAEAAPIIALPAMAKGAPITFLMNDYDLDYSLLAPVKADIDVTRPYPDVIRALKGKRVGVTARGGVTETFVRKMLAAAGLNPDKDVSYIAVGVGPSAVGAFQNDQVDAMVSLPPTEFYLGDGNYKTVVSNRTARDKVFGHDFILAAMTVNNQVLKADPEVVTRFCEAFKETTAYLHDPKNEPRVVGFISSYMNLPADKARAVFKAYEDNWETRLTPERWNAVAAAFNNTPDFATQVYKPCADISVR